MLYWLAQWLMPYHPDFHVLQYLTLRGIFSVGTSLLLTLILGPKIIRLLTKFNIGENVRDLAELTNHHSKSGTPTMGGGVIIIAIILSTLLWGDLANHFLWIIMAAMIGFAAIGAYDDYCKLMKKGKRGLSAKLKYGLQSIIALLIGYALYVSIQSDPQTHLVVPFFKDVIVHMGIAYIFWAYLVIVGTSNAVNLTDGLDGLAIMPAVLIAGALAIFAYLSGNSVFSHYLFIPFIQGAGEVIIFAGALIGAGLGFLWFNTYPAQVFMGDIGSLSIGAALGVMAVIVRQEIVFVIMSGIFVAETLSVILQVASFKMTGKRIFKMAPLHHHYELKGWPEPRIIVRFWIITLILVLISLATLKLR